jgi:ketosteroid isomerase-like protein
MATVVSSEVTIQFLDAFGNAWNGHDVGDIMTFMADDCAFETTAGPEVCGKRDEGREAVPKAFARVFNTFPDAHFGNARDFPAGDRGYTKWTFTGTGSDGKRVEVLGCDLFTLRDGKTALKFSYFRTRLG